MNFHASVKPATSFRPEIQGLRAIAVGLVLFFHVWPNALPGGYVGVDVFFVISGYLITGLLARAALRDGRISFLDFYSRRARRLLPVATATLAVTFLGTFVFLPQARWNDTIIQIAASALYIQNWVLAWLSVDYLGADNVASPVQHYWSLSVEEQFYFVWPLVMSAGLVLARRLGISATRVFAFSLSAIFACSLALSVFLTAREPAIAYFVSHTRAWELALGGLLALNANRINIASKAARAGMVVLGMAAIAFAAVAYSPETPFPGVAALVPTLGAALILAGGDVKLAGFRGLSSPLLTYLGDRSYSIYLWHWPFVVFYSATHQIGLFDGVAIIAITLAVSHFSYSLIEQRYRHAAGKAEWKPLCYAAASMLICVAAAGIFQVATDTREAIVVGARSPEYPGAAALYRGAPVPVGVEAIPPLVSLRRDLPVVYREKCHQNQKDVEPTSCTLGDLRAKRTMAVFGDSHAAQWVPALERIASQSGWRLVTFTKSACAFARVRVQLRNMDYSSCAVWRENVIEKLKTLKADLVVTSQSRYSYIKRDDMIEGIRSVWRDLTKQGAQVVALHDTPWMPFKPGECLAKGEPSKCTAPLEDVAAPKVFADVAKSMDSVKVVDLTAGICSATECASVVGNVIVRHDAHHLTATYAASLAPYLAEKAGLGPTQEMNDHRKKIAVNNQNH